MVSLRALVTINRVVVIFLTNLVKDWMMAVKMTVVQ